MGRQWFGLAAGLFALAGLSAAARAQGPDPGSVYVVSAALAGSGCPQGSVGSSFGTDRKSFTFIFDSFVAAAGPAVPGSESKKDCEITLMLNIPTGFQGGELTFDYRGYQQLSAAERGILKRKYSASKSASTTASVGAVARDYLQSDSVAFFKVKSCGDSPCLVAKIKMGIGKSSTTPTQMTIDSIDGKVTVSN